MLQLIIEPILQWPVYRSKKWPELAVIKSFFFILNKFFFFFKFQMTSPTRLTSSRDSLARDSHWLANIEISTHNQNIPRVWATPQFTFKVYELAENQKSDVPLKELNSQTVKIHQANPQASFPQFRYEK